LVLAVAMHDPIDIKCSIPAWYIMPRLTMQMQAQLKAGTVEGLRKAVPALTDSQVSAPHVKGTLITA